MRYAAPGCDARRIALDAKQELGTHEQSSQRALDPVFESPLTPALSIEGQQRLEIGVVTGRRYARRARPDRILLAHAASAAPAGAHEKIRSRLGALPAPVGVKGPAISTLRRYTPRRVSGMFTPAGYGRRKGSRVVSSSADVRLRKVMTPLADLP